MFRAQFKSRSPFESWMTIGSYGSEASAISAAMQKKKKGALMVRVIDKNNAVIYSG
jgi:hypothetical protein